MEHTGEFMGASAVVDGHKYGIQQRAGKNGLCVLYAIHFHHGHAITGGNSQLAQSGGQRPRPLFNLSEGVACMAILACDECIAVGCD
jgi:hypothetical protein